jgi:hypothetical protein
MGDPFCNEPGQRLSLDSNPANSPSWRVRCPTVLGEGASDDRSVGFVAFDPEFHALPQTSFVERLGFLVANKRVAVKQSERALI